MSPNLHSFCQLIFTIYRFQATICYRANEILSNPSRKPKTAMKHFAFEAARIYAHQRLDDLDAKYCYHSPAHTIEDVVPAVERLAAQLGVTGDDRLLLLTAAWYHDIGYTIQSTNHEITGCGVIREVLPGFGYTPTQIRLIEGIIMATRMPQFPANLLEEIMADADLDVLGRDDFWLRSLDLHTELVDRGEIITLSAWCRRQITFLEGHTYFTQAARSLRDPGKLRNIEVLKSYLAEIFEEPK